MKVRTAYTIFQDGFIFYSSYKGLVQLIVKERDREREREEERGREREREREMERDR